MQIEAIEVDTNVLNMPADGKMDTTAFRKKHDCVVKTPHTWVKSTEENVHCAKHWVADSTRCVWRVSAGSGIGIRVKGGGWGFRSRV